MKVLKERATELNVSLLFPFFPLPGHLPDNDFPKFDL